MRCAGNQYTTLLGPVAWRAPETFRPRTSPSTPGTIVQCESDVFMLGCTFLEVLTGCTRQPYDWLTEGDPASLLRFREGAGTLDVSPLQVRNTSNIPRVLFCS